MNNFFLPLIALTLSTMPLLAQTFNNLHSFTELVLSSSPSAWTNNDGANPQAKLVLSGKTLFGTSEFGGNLGNGSIFAINTDGTVFTNLYSFSAAPSNINSDGANPVCELILSSDILYGTSPNGGDANGTIFKIKTNGTEFANLHSFIGGDGGSTPSAGLILSGNTLYGTTANGGSFGFGTIFSINTNGGDFKILYNFNWSNDGAHPVSRLVMSGDTLYGTAQDGGDSGYGTLFKVNTDGSCFTNLHSFTAGNDETDNDGANPQAGLILSGDVLYGTTEIYGGLGAYGTVFSIHTNGTGYTNLYSFTGGNDGGFPEADLILAGNTLYGTANHGGYSDEGTVFALNTDGTGFTNLYSFTNAILPYNPDIDGGFPTNSDGAGPVAGLVLSDATLYGTASGAGISGNGTIFSLLLPPPRLTIISSRTNVILTWPTYAPDVTLQCTTNLISPTTWSTNILLPVLVNGQNTVTNPITGTRMFFRLNQ